MRFLKTFTLVLSLMFFSKINLSIASDDDVVCPEGGEEYKIAIVGHRYGLDAMEELIKGTHSKANCKPQFVEVVSDIIFASAGEYYDPDQFKIKLEAAFDSVKRNTELDAVLLHLDLNSIFQAASEVPSGVSKKERIRLLNQRVAQYKSILKDAAQILESASHIKAVLIPAGNHGIEQLSKGRIKYYPANLARFLQGTPFPSKKFMVVASANIKGGITHDTGFINCNVKGIIGNQAARLECGRNLFVKGQAIGLQTSIEKRKKDGTVINRRNGQLVHLYPETYLAASVVMFQLIKRNFQEPQYGRYFPFDAN